MLKKLSLASGLILLLLAASLSPFALEILGKSPRRDWSKISDISQSYTAAGSLISALAFSVVAAALLFQVRQTKVAQTQVARALHLELMRMALEDQSLRQAWRPTGDMSEERRRQLMYMNLIFTYFRSSYVIGEISESSLRRTLANRFTYELGRTFWQRAGKAFETGANGHRSRRFYEIAEELFQEASSREPLRPDRGEEASRRSQTFDQLVAELRAKVPGIAVATLAIGVGFVLGRQGRSR